MLKNAARGLLLLAAAQWVLGAPAAAQTAPATPTSSYEELRIVRHWLGLGLTRAQGEAIVPLLQELAKARVRADVLERAFYLETAEAVATWEMAQLRGQPLPDELRLWLGAACDRYARGRRPEDEASFKTANAVWEQLNDTQRLRIETDAAAKARLAKEDAERRRRDAALKLALADLGWVRNADDAKYPAERLTRAEAVAKAMWPEADAPTQQHYTARVITFYDAVRRMSAVQYNAASPRLPEQMKMVIDPPTPAPANAPVMTGTEWVAFVQDPRALVLLLQLLPVLPTGVAP